MEIKIQEEFGSDSKRFYVPYAPESSCPECGHLNKQDYIQLEYPRFNCKEQVYFVCSKCDCDYCIDITLKLSVEVDDE